jgi:hypothetical protein
MAANYETTPIPEDGESGSLERLTFTFEYEKQPGHIFLETVRLEARDGKTRQVEKAFFQSGGDHDGQLRSVIDRGAVEAMYRLAALLAMEVQRSARKDEI